MGTITDNWINYIDNRNAFESIEWNWEALYPHDCFTSINARVPFDGGVIEIFTGNLIPHGFLSSNVCIEASFDPEHPDGLDSALNHATFHVGIFDNEGNEIQCPITNGIFPEEGDTHGANLEPHEVGRVILQFQND